MPFRVSSSPISPGLRSRSGPTSDDPGVARQVLGGLALGAREDPILGFIMNKIVNSFPGADPAVFSQLESQLGSGAVVDTAKLIGQFGPLLLGGLGLAKAGVAAGGAIARGVAPSLAAGGGRLAGQAQRVQRFAQGAEGGIVGTPGLQRGIEIGATAGAFGSFGAAESAARGNDLPQVARDALLTAALSGTVEVGFLGAARALRPFSKQSVDVRRATRRANTPEFQKAADDFELGLKERAQKLRTDVGEALGVAQLSDDVAQAVASLGGAPIAEAPTLAALRQQIFTRELKDMKQEIRGVKTALRGFRDFRRMAEDPLSYTREEALNPDSVGLFIQAAASKIAKSPEGFKGQLGQTVNKFVDSAKLAEFDIILGDSANSAMVMKIRNRAMAVLGKKDLPVKMMAEVSKYEKAPLGTPGWAAVQPALQEVFRDIEKLLNLSSRRLNVRGGESLLTPDEFLRNGVNRFFPHTMAQIDESKFVEQFLDGATKRFMISNSQLGPNEARSAAQDVLTKSVINERNGLKQFGSMEQQRRVTGSLAEKLAEGMPLEKDPFMAMLTYVNAVERRVAYGKRFGFGKDVREQLINMAEREGASPRLVNTVVDSFLGHKYEPVFNRAWARRLTNYQMGTKLALAVIPNMSQSINTGLFFGLRNNLRGVFKSITASGAERERVRQSLALHEEVFQMMRRSYLGEATNSVSDRFANFVLKYTGFSSVERMNRLYAGTTGYFTFRDIVAKHLDNRLKGQSLTIARRRMSRMGIDIDAIKRRGHPTHEEETRAIFRAAQETQFIPDQARRPSFWTTPHGRVMFQFKTFAQSQGRFLRDNIFLEAGQGNYKPLATFLGVYPIAGELVASTVSALKDRQRDVNGIDRVVQNLSYVGAGGLVQQAVAGAQFGRLAETLLGPTVSDATEFAGAFLRLDPGQFIRQIERQPIWDSVRLALAPGLFGVQAAREYLQAANLPGDDNEAVTLAELRQGRGGFRP